MSFDGLLARRTTGCRRCRLSDLPNYRQWGGGLPKRPTIRSSAERYFSLPWPPPLSPRVATPPIDGRRDNLSESPLLLPTHTASEGRRARPGIAVWTLAPRLPHRRRRFLPLVSRGRASKRCSVIVVVVAPPLFLISFSLPFSSPLLPPFPPLSPLLSSFLFPPFSSPPLLLHSLSFWSWQSLPRQPALEPGQPPSRPRAAGHLCQHCWSTPSAAGVPRRPPDWL